MDDKLKAFADYHNLTMEGREQLAGLIEEARQQAVADAEQAAADYPDTTD